MRNPSTVFAAAVVGLCTGPVLAWGNEGHQVVALVAQRHLSNATATKVAALIGAEQGQLANVATWADCIKTHSACAADDGSFDNKIHPETKPWHFVDIPLPSAGYDPARDCASDGCVVARIAAYRATLADPGSSPTDSLLALKFLVHFVGDVHQPLHAAFKNLPGGKSDRGGNDRFVKAPPDATTDLHAFWDTNLVKRELDDVAGNLAAYATAIDQGAAPALGDADPVAWANASHALATASYRYTGVGGPHGLAATDPVSLPASYVTRSRAIVRKQLRLAGLRLAALLNQALDPEGAKGVVATRELDSDRD
jgi:hypothetical protein